MWLIGTAFLIHIVFLISVFDIYFKTPITYVNENYVSPVKPPAKRLVLFVADGLRAQSIYNYTAIHSHPIRNDITVKYLKQIISNGFAWGISYTQVPTESRPGHVALLGGFFEDPSAVMKGWKENPVDFDSVLNQTKESWCWGSPDILPIFSKGGNHIHKFMYNVEETQFGRNETTKLDTWVFDQVEQFLQKAEKNSELKSSLSENKIMFFLHLLGIDTAGHSYKPHSREYTENIRIVDEGIEKITRIIENYYNNDGKTAFVFTSDHGMTSWGSHGSGDPTETDCPIIAWGAGITKDAQHNYMSSVNQIDIAVLMSTLIGVPVPMNSLGIIPDRFLDLNEQELALAYLANVKQIIAQYKAKRKESEGLRYFKNFKPLTKELLKYRLKEIQSLIDSESFDNAITLSKHLIKSAIAGIKFYQNFYQVPMLITNILSIILWIIILLGHLLKENIVNSMDKYSTSARILEKFGRTSRYKFIVLFTVTCSSCFVKSYRLPAMCYIYFGLPQFLLWYVYLKRNTWKNGWKTLKDYDRNDIKKIIYNVVFYVVAIEFLIQVFFYRWVLTILIYGIGAWTYYSLKHVFTTSVLCSWIFSTIVLAIFPLLTVIGNDSNIFVFAIGGILWMVISIFIAFYDVGKISNNSDVEEFPQNLLLGMCQVGLTAFSFLITLIVRYGGIPSGLQTQTHIITWIITGISIILPLFGKNDIVTRLGHVIVGLATPFIFLSVSYEPIFLLTLTLHLFTWVIIEHRANVRSVKMRFSHTKSDIDITQYDAYMLKTKSFDTSLNLKQQNLLRILNMHDFRRAFCYLFYLLFSFFGIGNIASINSFDPMWVICFVSVFNPFLMTVLILCKTIFIFIVVTANFRAINVVVDGSFKNILYIILVYCDFMIIHFLCFVKNEGSWLDIGLSISHFVIIEATALFIMVLYVSVSYYTTFSFTNRVTK